MAKKKQKNKQSRNQYADHGSAERRQHGIFVEVETAVAGVKAIRNVTTDPIATYKARGTITPEQFLAADNFAHEYRQAALSAVYAHVRFGHVPTGGLADGALVKIQQSKLRVRKALQHVGYPLADILEHVVGDSQVAGSWKGVRMSKRPDQDGMVALRLALDGLVAWYKI
jgi:hypothetical protein